MSNVVLIFLVLALVYLQVIMFSLSFVLRRFQPGQATRESSRYALDVVVYFYFALVLRKSRHRIRSFRFKNNCMTSRISTLLRPSRQLVSNPVD